MNRGELRNSFLLEQFREFYKEIINQKKWIESQKVLPESESVESLAAEKDPTASVRTTLLNLLEKQVPEARRRGGEYGVTFYKDAQYVMAALGDEIFINMEWDGKKKWGAQLLEYKLFGTNVAGDLFFQKIDNLIKDPKPAYMEMAAVYFLTISLGFKGKFRGMQEYGQIDSYRNQLFGMIFQKSPDLLEETRRLLPQPYAHTISGGEGKKLPYIKSWIWLIAIFILVFLIVSHMIWTHHTDNLIRVVDEFLIKLGK